MILFNRFSIFADNGVFAMCSVINESAVKDILKDLPPDETFTLVAETFGAIADSNRAKILFAIEDKELCVSDLATIVNITDSAVSQHLRILRNLRLVKSRKEGRMIYYTLDDEHIGQLLHLCLDHIEDGSK